MLGINVHVVIWRHVAVPHTHIWTGKSRHCSRFHRYIDLIQEIESHLAEVPAARDSSELCLPFTSTWSVYEVYRLQTLALEASDLGGRISHHDLTIIIQEIESRPSRPASPSAAVSKR